MVPENMIWGATAAVISLTAKYFFDRWNRLADERNSEDTSPINARECRHNRTNCSNIYNLQLQQMTMQMDEMRSELHSIRGILLVVATQGGVPAEKLTALTK